MLSGEGGGLFVNVWACPNRDSLCSVLLASFCTIESLFAEGLLYYAPSYNLTSGSVKANRCMNHRDVGFCLRKTDISRVGTISSASSLF